MKKKVKGFTLMEMVIVLALFSFVMYSVVQILDPVSKFFVRSSNYADTTACQDNIRRCVEGNLKYANRVRAHNQVRPYILEADSNSINVPNRALITPELKADLDDFYNTFFKDRKCIDTSGSIYVLVFDNEVFVDDATLQSSFNYLSDYAGIYNAGQITLYEFKYDSYADVYGYVDSHGILTPLSLAADAVNYEVPSSCGSGQWAVNSKLYGIYDYHFQLMQAGDFLTHTDTTVAGTTTTAAATTTTVAATTTTAAASTTRADIVFNPADFALKVTMKEIKREDGFLVRDDVSTTMTSAFAMLNVLDSNKMFSVATYDPVPTLKAGMTENQLDCYEVLASNYKPRYEAMDSTEANGFDGFYFIFTLADTTDTYIGSHVVTDGAGNPVTDASGYQIWPENTSTAST